MPQVRRGHTREIAQGVFCHECERVPPLRGPGAAYFGCPFKDDDPTPVASDVVEATESLEVVDATDVAVTKTTPAGEATTEVATTLEAQLLKRWAGRETERAGKKQRRD